jgi:hypothetical protein
MRNHSRWIGIAVAALAMFLAASIDPIAPFASFIGEAHAVLGRPATPGSVAGVARRTTRRVIRRSAIYASTLPAGCVRTSVNGVVVWRCGPTYYQPYGGRYVVVYID